MTKEQFDTEFKMEDLKYIAEQYEVDGIPDRPARREYYNNKMDSHDKNGILTEYQLQNWSIPDNLETTLYWL